MYHRLQLFPAMSYHYLVLSVIWVNRNSSLYSCSSLTFLLVPAYEPKRGSFSMLLSLWVVDDSNLFWVFCFVLGWLSFCVFLVLFCFFVLFLFFCSRILFGTEDLSSSGSSWVLGRVHMSELPVRGSSQHSNPSPLWQPNSTQHLTHILGKRGFHVTSSVVVDLWFVLMQDPGPKKLSCSSSNSLKSFCSVRAEEEGSRETKFCAGLSVGTDYFVNSCVPDVGYCPDPFILVSSQ